MRREQLVELYNDAMTDDDVDDVELHCHGDTFSLKIAGKH